MIEQTCKCCGQTLPMPMRLNFPLRERSRRLLNHIYQAGEYGIAQERLFGLLYDDDPNGGPESGLKSMHVRISQLNRQLRPHGWEVRGRFGANSGRYTLIKLGLNPTETAKHLANILQQGVQA